MFRLLWQPATFEWFDIVFTFTFLGRLNPLDLAQRIQHSLFVLLSVWLNKVLFSLTDATSLWRTDAVTVVCRLKTELQMIVDEWWVT